MSNCCSVSSPSTGVFNNCGVVVIMTVPYVDTRESSGLILVQAGLPQKMS